MSFTVTSPCFAGFPSASTVATVHTEGGGFLRLYRKSGFDGDDMVGVFLLWTTAPCGRIRPPIHRVVARVIVAGLEMALTGHFRTLSICSSGSVLPRGCLASSGSGSRRRRCVHILSDRRGG